MADETPFSKAELLRRMRAGWDEFSAYLDSLSEDQMTVPVDAVGWTAKDHVISLAVWESGVCALLEGRSQREGMGFDQAAWADIHNDDQINAAIWQRHQATSLAEALRMLQAAHDRLVSIVESLTEEDLLKPYRAYDQDSDADGPVYSWIIGNCFGHYAEHRPWIEAIVSRR